MTAKEFRHALKALGLTQTGAARLLGVDGRTVRYWTSGDRSVPEPVSRFLRFLAAADIAPDEVMKALQMDGP